VGVCEDYKAPILWNTAATATKRLVDITEIKTGDEVLGWLRLGLALVPTRTKDGSLLYTVPSKPRRAIAGTLTAFIGLISANDTSAKVLTLHVMPMNSDLRPLGNAYTSELVSIHYTALSRMRLMSKIAFAPREETGQPGKKDPIGATAFKPYKTLTEVKL